jgi:hypothetical protein
MISYITAFKGGENSWMKNNRYGWSTSGTEKQT